MPAAAVAPLRDILQPEELCGAAARWSWPFAHRVLLRRLGWPDLEVVRRFKYLGIWAGWAVTLRIIVADALHRVSALVPVWMAMPLGRAMSI